MPTDFRGMHHYFNPTISKDVYLTKQFTFMFVLLMFA